MKSVHDKYSALRAMMNGRYRQTDQQDFVATPHGRFFVEEFVVPHKYAWFTERLTSLPTNAKNAHVAEVSTDVFSEVNSSELNLLSTMNRSLVAKVTEEFRDFTGDIQSVFGTAFDPVVLTSPNMSRARRVVWYARANPVTVKQKLVAVQHGQVFSMFPPMPSTVFTLDFAPSGPRADQIAETSTKIHPAVDSINSLGYFDPVTERAIVIFDMAWYYFIWKLLKLPVFPCPMLFPAWLLFVFRDEGTDDDVRVQTEAFVRLLRAKDLTELFEVVSKRDQANALGNCIRYIGKKPMSDTLRAVFGGILNFKALQNLAGNLDSDSEFETFRRMMTEPMWSGEFIALTLAYAHRMYDEDRFVQHSTPQERVLNKQAILLLTANNVAKSVFAESSNIVAQFKTVWGPSVRRTQIVRYFQWFFGNWWFDLEPIQAYPHIYADS